MLCFRDVIRVMDEVNNENFAVLGIIWINFCGLWRICFKNTSIYSIFVDAGSFRCGFIEIWVILNMGSVLNECVLIGWFKSLDIDVFLLNRTRIYYNL